MILGRSVVKVVTSNQNDYKWPKVPACDGRYELVIMLFRKQTGWLIVFQRELLGDSKTIVKK